MKLKVKLAQDYMRTTPHSDYTDDVCDTDVYLAYMAGFEKAREMAYHQSIACVKTAPIDILNLGEENE